MVCCGSQIRHVDTHAGAIRFLGVPRPCFPVAQKALLWAVEQSGSSKAAPGVSEVTAFSWLV